MSCLTLKGCALQLLSWEPVDKVVMKMAINELYSWKNLEVEVSVLSGVQDVCSCSVENGHQRKILLEEEESVFKLCTCAASNLKTC